MQTAKKTILYYTCNTHEQKIEQMCRDQLLEAGLPITSVSLNKHIYFGNTRLVVEGKRSVEMMHKQIVYGLTETVADIVFLCENDVLYHPSHFEFTPARDDTFFFNTNVYKRWVDGVTVWTDDLQQLSGVCAYRELLLEFFTRRLKQIEEQGDNRHYEPGRHYASKTENWVSAFPNLDIRHNGNLTKSKRTPEEFRNPNFAKGFRIVEKVPYWDDEEMKRIEI